MIRLRGSIGLNPIEYLSLIKNLTIIHLVNKNKTPNHYSKNHNSKISPLTLKKDFFLKDARIFHNNAQELSLNPLKKTPTPTKISQN